MVLYVLTVVLSYSLYHLLTNTQTGTRFADQTRQAIAFEQLRTQRTHIIVYAGGYFEIFDSSLACCTSPRSPRLHPCGHRRARCIRSGGQTQTVGERSGALDDCSHTCVFRICYPLPRSTASPAAHHALTVCCSARAGWRDTRREPRPGLSANPSTPSARNRCTHL